MTTPVKMLLIYLDETDLHETGRLYEAIIRRLRQLGVNGATAVAGHRLLKSFAYQSSVSPIFLVARLD